MPTVLDYLRRQLLGDDAANKLELSLDILNARIFSRSRQKTRANGSSSRSDIEFVELAKPSPGYEPLLMKMGWNPFAARGLAKFVVRRAKLRAKESKLYRQVINDIRILAKGPRQQAALIRCAQRLRDMWEVTPFVGELLYKANVDDFEFMRLLKLAAEGHRKEFNRVTEIAAKVAPQLSIKRGPKISAASAAYESFLTDEFGLGLGPWPKPQQDRAAEYVDALTAATREEFKNSNFDPRPAQRRTTLKRLNSLRK